MTDSGTIPHFRLGIERHIPPGYPYKWHNPPAETTPPGEKRDKGTVLLSYNTPAIFRLFRRSSMQFCRFFGGTRLNSLIRSLSLEERPSNFKLVLFFLPKTKKSMLMPKKSATGITLLIEGEFLSHRAIEPLVIPVSFSNLFIVISLSSQSVLIRE